VAWRMGLVACLGSGLIELAGSMLAGTVRQRTPRAALLSTLAGIGLAFITLGFLFRAYARPVIGLTTLGIIVLIYFGRVRFRGGVPGGLVAVGVGTLLAWLTGVAPVGERPDAGVGFFPPVPVIGDVFVALGDRAWLSYLSIIFPMGLFNVLGSLQNIESAEAAGDPYRTKPSLAVNGIGTVAAAFFGSCFPTTIYIGHPGWKALGARAGYSVLNAAFFTVVCLTGTLTWIVWAVPIDAGLAIVIWIGMVITAQAFQATEPRHAPAVVVGILPGVGAWGALVAKNALRAAGVGVPGGEPFSAQLIAAFRQTDTWIHGAFALEQGCILTAMLLAAATVAVIDRRFVSAAVWCGAASVLSALGIIHSYRWTSGDTVIDLSPAWPWAIGYAVMSLSLLAARWITVEREGDSTL